MPATASEHQRPAVNLQKRLRGLLNMLLVQFVLGITLVTLVSFDGEGKPPLKHLIVLGIHVIFALGILAAAIMLAVTGRRAGGEAKSKSMWGLLAVGLSFAGGLVTVLTPWHEFGSFVMGLSFMLALSVYALWYFRLPAERS